MAITPGTIRFAVPPTDLPDDPAYLISADEINASLVVAGGTDGHVLVRDSAQPSGFGLTDTSALVGPAGPTGATGATGAQGPAGPEGPAGGILMDQWVWLAPATSATVGAGRVGVNTDNPSVATAVYMHKVAGGSGGIDWTVVIGDLVAGDKLYVQKKGDGTQYFRYTVTGTPTLIGGTTFSIPVVFTKGTTEPANGSDVVVAFQRMDDVAVGLIEGVVPGTISGVAQLYVETTGTLKIKFGNGTVKTVTLT